MANSPSQRQSHLEDTESYPAFSEQSAGSRADLASAAAESAGLHGFPSGPVKPMDMEENDNSLTLRLRELRKREQLCRKRALFAVFATLVIAGAVAGIVLSSSSTTVEVEALKEFNALDINHDHLLTEPELKASPRNHEIIDSQVHVIFEHLDLNHDTFVQETEFKATYETYKFETEAFSCVSDDNAIPNKKAFPECLNRVEWLRREWQKYPQYEAAGVNGTEGSLRHFLFCEKYYCPSQCGHNCKQFCSTETCSGRGTCRSIDGTCSCEGSYSGRQCEKALPSPSSPSPPASSSPTPSSSCATILKDVDLVSFDIGQASSATAAGCCSLCKERAGCKAFSWADYNGGICYFKGKMCQKISKVGVVSGILDSSFVSDCPACGNDDPTTISVVTMNLFWWKLFGQLGGGDFFNQFKKYGPFDIMLFQECDDVNHIIQGLSFASCFAPDPGQRAVAVAWNNKRFAVLGQGKEDVAEDSPAQYYGHRSVVWVRLQEKTSGKTFFAASHHGPLPVNTGGETGGNAVASRIQQVISANIGPNDSLFLAGDFNADKNSETVRALSGMFSLEASDWVDMFFTNGKGLGEKTTTTIYGTGSDHRGLKVVFSLP